MSSNEKNKTGKSSVLQQWRNRKKKTGVATQKIKRPDGEAAIASHGQKRLWLLQQLYLDNPFYQYGHLYKIKGALDVKVLSQCFQQLVERHEILRSNYVSDGNQLLLKTRPSSIVDIQQVSVEGLSEVEKQTRAGVLAKEAASRLFDLATEPLLRLTLIKLDAEQHWLVLSMHHIIGDRTSLQILNQEVFSTYQASISNQAISAKAVNVQYSDYAWWQNKQSISPKTITYWNNQLADAQAALALSHDFKRPRQASFKGQSLSKKLSPELTAKLRELAKKHSTTVYVLMLAAFKTLLYRHSNQSDILVGSPFSTRDKVELEDSIGFYNETLVLRTQAEQALSFDDWITKVKTCTMEAFEHKNMPFDELVSQLQPERHGSANPLFQVMYLYNSVEKNAFSKLDLEIEEASIDLEVSKFDLTLFVNDYGYQLETVMEYATDLYRPSSILRMQDQMETLLQSVAADSSLLISRIPILDTAETNKLLNEWNETNWEMPDYQSIHQVIDEMAQKYPQEVAVFYENETLSYAELQQQASAIAQHLVQAGVQPNTFVGLYTHRSLAMVAGIVGILKAGAAYLPLDPEYPADRIEHMLQDSKTAFILSQEALTNQLTFSQSAIIAIEPVAQQTVDPQWQAPTITSDHYAYLIYTSGSTGLPKGVPIQHKNLLHSTLSRFSFYPANPTAFLLLSSFSFDSSVVGLFWTLCSGGKLVLPPKRIEQDVMGLSQLIHQQKVSHTLMLPSLYSAILNLVAVEQLSSLKNVMVAGEACPFPLIEKHFKLLPDTELYNEYGPTEASVWCIAHKITLEDKAFVPIGKAIPNTQVYILDQHLQAVPIGVAGEIYIGGLGLSEGYLNRPELTSSKFITHPFKAGERIYKTGDLARFHENGVIEFLGRVDQQVKIRGFRVEPEEIQKVILQFEAVEEALVLVHPQPLQLVAYTSGLSDSAVAELRFFCKEKLPDYMIPGLFIPLESFPRLPNGKINRKALPDPTQFISKSDDTFVAPQSHLEEQLTAIWQEVLKQEVIGIKDNFFAIGGDSILSIQVVSKAKDKGIHLAPNQLFEYQTIADLAQSIESVDVMTTSQNQLSKKLDQYPLSYLQQAFLFNSNQAGIDQGILPLEFYLEGVEDIVLFQKAWQMASERHDAMRTYIQSEDGSLPRQLVADSITLSWDVLDWSEQTIQEQQESISDFRQREQETPINLYEAPASRLCFIKLSDQKQLLFWTCHHIFLDGWSCGIILKDALAYYDALSQNQEAKLDPVSNYPAYLQWESEQDKEPARRFWMKTLEGFDQALSFQSDTSQSNKSEPFVTKVSRLSEATTTALQQYSQAQNVSLSTLFQGIWALLLSRFFNREDVLYGLTVSGRFADFKGIESTSGLFMNVIPNRFKIDTTQSFGDWLSMIQKEQGQKNKFESTGLQQIQAWIEWPAHQALFDSLFVFGNFLKDGIQEGSVKVANFEGGFSSNYPLAIRINPLSNLEISYRYAPQRLSGHQFDWIQKTMQQFIELICSGQLQNNIAAISKALEPSPYQEKGEPVFSEAVKVVAPRNKLERELHQIWTTLFGLAEISVNQNFFELGGNSLMALSLFAKIEEQLGHVLPPATLFTYSNIAAIATRIEQGAVIKDMPDCLVPLRTTGDKAPLFCLHGGGAHVFFYTAFSAHLPEGQPVYSIQPPGLDGASNFHESIAEMASHYIKAIKTVQPEGPYHLLGTCFSNAVALEMAKQLNVKGEVVAHLFIIDSGPVHLFGDDQDGKRKTFSRFYDMLKRGDFERIKRKLKNRLQIGSTTTPNTTVAEPLSVAQQNLQRTIDSLNRLYAQYNWEPYAGKIQLIRSSEFHQRSEKKYHLTQWTRLAKGGLDVHIVEGHHKTLFEEPEVKGLSEKIAQCIEAQST